MTMFSDTVLAGLQAQSEDNLPHLAQIHVHSTVRGPGGVEEETWTPGVGDIPCRLAIPRNLRTAEGEAGGRVRVSQPWVVILPLSHSSTDSIREQDRLVITDPEKGWTRTVEVTTISGPRSYEVMRKLFAVEVK